MAGIRCCCSGRGAVLLMLASAIPLGLLIAFLERASEGSVEYRSGGWLRESVEWDPLRHRFLVSTFFNGSIAEIPLPAAADVSLRPLLLRERVLIADPDVAGNASLGIAIDAERDRLLVVYADVFGLRYAALGAYSLDSGQRLFLAPLPRPGNEPLLADDVAVDGGGNAYVTDARANKIWKVGVNGELLSIIRSDVFFQKGGWRRNFIGLNGIAYHPNGYLLVVHTAAGRLFKVDVATEEARVVKLAGSLLLGDGVELISPTELVVAGTPSARLVESYDDWRTATVTARYVGPLHRVATSATGRGGKVYVGHLLGLGFFAGRTHVIAEAVFTPVSA